MMFWNKKTKKTDLDDIARQLHNLDSKLDDILVKIKLLRAMVDK